MDAPIVTVLTATYNRKEFLRRLFVSLEEQTDKRFEWLIIDDGSVDGTEEIVNELKAVGTVSMKYFYKPNGGKHTALNYGYQYIATPLTFIVDSDDYLTADAIECITQVHNENESNETLCGYSFLRKSQNGKFLHRGRLPKNGVEESYVACRINRNLGGDMAEVWKTSCLKEYPFPEFLGERFLGEDVVWIRMSERYKLRFYDNAIYVSDYLEGGLTTSRRKHNIKSPNGCVLRAECFLNAKVRFKARIKANLQYTIYGKFAGMSFRELYCRSKKKAFFLFWYLPACILYLNWKRKYAKN